MNELKIKFFFFLYFEACCIFDGHVDALDTRRAQSDSGSNRTREFHHTACSVGDHARVALAELVRLQRSAQCRYQWKQVKIAVVQRHQRDR